MKSTAPDLKIEARKIARTGTLELGAYIPGKPIREVKKAYGLKEVVKLASNECPLPLPSSIQRMMTEEVENLVRYPDGHCRELRRRLSDRLGVSPDRLLFGNGAEECVRLIGQAFLNPGDKGIVPSPVYDAYDTAIRLPGGEVIKIPLKDYHIDLEATLASVDERTKIVWFCSPANPTGTVISREAFDRFLERLPDNVLVVLDEAYCEFVTAKDAAHALDYQDRDARVVGLRTFSKAYGLAGLRVGYVVAHPSVIEIIAMVKLPFNVNVLAQAAAICMLEEEDFVRRHVQLIREQREIMKKAIEDRGLFVAPSEANFLFVRLPLDGDEFFKRLLPQGMIVRPGSIFGSPDFIRLSIGTGEQNRRFLSLLDEALLERADG